MGMVLLLLLATLVGCNSTADREPALIPARQGEYWGLLKANGDWWVPPQFLDVGIPSNGRLRATNLDGRCGYLDESGKWIIEPVYRACGCFHQQIAAVADAEGRIHWIDAAGEVQHTLPDSVLAVGTQLAEERFPAKTAAGWGVFSLDGAWVLSPAYKRMRNFSDGLAAVAISADSLRGEALNWGFISINGKTAIEPRYDWVADFCDGRAAAEVDGRVGLLDTQGSLSILPKYDAAGAFSDNLVPVQQNGHWGYLRRNGDWHILPRFLETGGFSQGRAPVCFPDRRWGFINREGQTDIQPQFDWAGSFYKGLAAIRFNGKMGAIRLTGAVAINPVYDELKLAPPVPGFVFANPKVVPDEQGLLRKLLDELSEDRFMGWNDRSVFGQLVNELQLEADSLALAGRNLELFATETPIPSGIFHPLPERVTFVFDRPLAKVSPRFKTVQRDGIWVREFAGNRRRAVLEAELRRVGVRLANNQRNGLEVSQLEQYGRALAKRVNGQVVRRSGNAVWVENKHLHLQLAIYPSNVSLQVKFLKPKDYQDRIVSDRS